MHTELLQSARLWHLTSPRRRIRTELLLLRAHHRLWIGEVLRNTTHRFIVYNELMRNTKRLRIGERMHCLKDGG